MDTNEIADAIRDEIRRLTGALVAITGVTNTNGRRRRRGRKPGRKPGTMVRGKRRGRPVGSTNKGRKGAKKSTAKRGGRKRSGGTAMPTSASGTEGA